MRPHVGQLCFCLLSSEQAGEEYDRFRFAAGRQANALIFLANLDGSDLICAIHCAMLYSLKPEKCSLRQPF